MGKQKVLVIIPAYNEEKSIGNVLARIKENADADILVINDGSSDATFKEALKAGVRVISLPFNLGIGGAMQTGYRFARDQGYDIAVQVDADGQHDPVYLNAMITKILDEQYDMVIGSRYISDTSYRSTFTRRIGMIIFSWIVYILTDYDIKDTTSGFRAVNRKVIEFFASNYPSDYPEVDVLVKLFKKNYRVCEIPVEMLNRESGKSSITPLKSVYYMIKVSMALIINSLRSGEAT
ncbi:MAG: glycosyltransferase family 2 protein [Clostridia bacterium]|nr:glycosyltransferase family 2 protein [Clostridia bacterium]